MAKHFQTTLFMILALSAESQAQTKVAPTPAPVKAVECPSEEVRLDAPGGPLENSPVQDQDGMNICYANTSSVMLQAAIPEHPEISAIDLSIQTYKDNSTRMKSGNFYYDRTVTDAQGKEKIESTFFNDIGHVSEVLKTAKLNGVCPRSNSLLESGGLFEGGYSDPENSQSVVLQQTAQFINEMNSAKSPGFKENFSSTVPELRKIYQKNLADHKTMDAGKSNNLPRYHRSLLDVAYPGDENKAKRENAKKDLDTYFLENHKYAIDTNQHYEDFEFSEMANLQKKYPEFVEVLKANKETSKDNLDKDKTYRRIMDPTYAFWIDAEAHLGKSTYWKTCDDSIKLSGGLYNIATSFGQVGAYLEFENFLNGLDHPDVNLVLGAVAPKCLDEKNRIKIPETLEFVKYEFPDPKPAYDKNKNLINYDQIMTYGRNRILWSVKGEKPLPVAMSICSAIISKKTVYNKETKSNDPLYTNNDPASCKAAGGGSHSVLVIGARKNKKSGVCEYLIQNSWGAECGSVAKRECKNGKFWMEEEELLLNSNGISKVVNKEKK
jgi:hypothetical protein